MTRVAYIHGTNPFQDTAPIDEWAQRAAQVPVAAYIAYDTMTEGGMKLSLLREQLGIMRAFYPDNVQYKAAHDRVSQALEGRRVSGYYSGGTTPMLDAVNKAIAKAIRKTQPAIGAIVPLDDCNRTKQQFAADPRYKDIKECLFCDPIMQRYHDRCNNLNYYPRVLNEHLEKSAHHMLYKFANRPTSPSVVVTKSVLHATAIDELAQLSGLSRDNMVSWYRNGVMRSNANGGLAPLQPEQTITAFKDSIQAGVGEPLTIAALTTLITIIVSAVGATVKLIQSLRASDQVAFENTVRGAGNESWGPEKGDFENTGGGLLDGGASSDWLLPAAVAAGAYFLLK